MKFKYLVKDLAKAASLLVANSMAAIMIATTVTMPSTANAKSKSLTMIDDLKSLSTAINFTVPQMTKDAVKDDIIKEIDSMLRSEMGSSFGELANDSEKLNAARATKMQELTSNGSYLPAVAGASSIYDGEVWKRQMENAHQTILDAKKVEMQRGDVLEYNLSESEVPYGGYFFPDNLGGITRRWNNGRIDDEIGDYQTFFEKAWKETKKEIRDAEVNNLSKANKEILKDQCQQQNKIKRELSAISDKIEKLEGKIDEMDDGSDKKEEKEKELEVLQDEFRNLQAKVPALVNFMQIDSQDPNSLDIVDCYLLNNYARTKKMTENRVQKVLQNLKQETIDGLSPTEKYDILNGFYDFRTTAFEKEYKGKRRFAETKKSPFFSLLLLTRFWEGRCNADRACGICHRDQEPSSQVSMQISEIGKILNFQPLDTKALLMSTYFYLEDDKYAQMGVRTEELFKTAPNPNPGAFDILLRSLFMKHKVPFVIDNKNDHHVTNVTVIGFKRTVDSVSPLKPRQKRALMAKASEALDREGADQLKDFNPNAGADSWENPRKLYQKVENASKVMRVTVDLKILAELSTDDANKSTKKLIAEEKAGRGKFTKKNTITYDLYLTDDGEIVEGDFVKGELDFLWFAAGKGNQENKEGGNSIIKYDVINSIAKKAANGGGETERITNESIKAITTNE